MIPNRSSTSSAPKLVTNKKVLLRRRKRHTARRVASTCSTDPSLISGEGGGLTPSCPAGGEGGGGPRTSLMGDTPVQPDRRYPYPVLIGMCTLYKTGWCPPPPILGWTECPLIGWMGYPHVRLDAVTPPPPNQPGWCNLPPPLWTDRYLRKQYLPHSIWMRGVKERLHPPTTRHNLTTFPTLHGF